MCSSNQNQKWITLAEVSPKSGCDSLDGPAYVNIVGLAADEDSFVELVRSECLIMKFQLTKLEDTELWQARIINSQPGVELRALVASLSVEVPLKFDSFYCFPKE